MQIKIEKTKNPKQIPETVNSFGEIFTDHMFVMDYEEGKGWHDARIVPYAPISLDPGTAVFHYGQGIFEGLKAYKNEKGEIRLFRPEMNFKRLNRSAARVAMPEIDVEEVIDALSQLVLLDQDWIPTAPGTSLYIRPFMLATDVTLNIHNSRYFKFIIILSPSGSYYKNGLEPVDIVVEKKYVRAVRGGLGEAKTMANYAASILASTEAESKGYSQVLWLDGVENKYIEEVGSMNIMFKIDGTVVTPKLNGSILPGVTRDSILNYLRAKGIPAEERRISLDELIQASRDGKLEEIFGTGTAAVISPVKKLICDDEIIEAKSDYDENSLSRQLYNDLTGIQLGTKEDEFGWTRVLN